MTSLGNLGLQGVNISPKFIFGINGNQRHNLHVVDGKKLLYVAGHNVIIYNEDKTQYFIPGSEGTEGINTVAVSQSGKYLAICEKNHRA